MSTKPELPCPGFYIGDVALASGARSGIWGIEVGLTEGNRELSGGLNLGGGFEADGKNNAWGAFNIANPDNEPQVVRIRLDAQALPTPGFSAANLALDARLVDAGRNLVGSLVSGPPPLQFTRTVNPGFYIIEVRSLSGSPQGTFQLSAETSFTDRLGGGFQGGAVVGGFLTLDGTSNSLHGFAAFCIATAQNVSFKTYSIPTYGAGGAGDLLLTVYDRDRNVVYRSPTSTSTTTSSTSSSTGPLPSTTSSTQASTTTTTQATSTTTTSTTTTTIKTTTTTTTTSTTTTSTTSTTTTQPAIRIEVRDTTGARVSFASLNNTPGSLIQLRVVILNALNQPLARSFSTSLIADPQASGSPVNIRRVGASQDVLEITPGDDCLNACSATLLVDTAGAAPAKVAVSVEGVSLGAAGGNINDPDIDSAGRVYMVFPNNHTILRADSVTGAATVYAGTPGISGPQDGPRQSARFNGPSFLSIDRINNRLYLSDSNNRAVRLLQLAGAETVSTLATGFSNPQGVAFDAKNRLWVVDSGSQTILLLDLNESPVKVKRIAGSPGSPGDFDGTGDAARFRSPVGIAIEKDYPPLVSLPVRVLVVDQGNGKIKRVLDTGEVTTVATLDSSVATAEGLQLHPPNGEAASLTGVGIAVDPVGNVFVSDRRGVWALLPGGRMSPVAQSATIEGANGLTVPEVGRLLVSAQKISIQTGPVLKATADARPIAGTTAPAFDVPEQGGTVFGIAEVSFPEPRITSVSPKQVTIRGGERVTIRGANFLPDSQVLIGSRLVDPELVVVPDTTTVVITTPALNLNGLTTVGVLHRGGIAETTLQIQGTQTPEITALGKLESPTPGQSVVGTLSGTGWAFLVNGKSGTLPSRLEIWIDDQFAALADTGIYRIDLQDAYERQGIIAPARTGFQFTVSNGLVATGRHTLSVRAYNPSSVGPAFFEIARIQFTLLANPCNYSISPTGSTHGSDNDAGSFGILAAKGCRWTAASNAGWITIRTGSSGEGIGTVTYALTANTKTSQRTGTITVSGQNFSQSFTITQHGTTVPSCSLFGDDFNSGSTQGWITSGGTWQAVKGKFQVGGVVETATAQHVMRSSSYFELSVDLEFNSLNGLLGFYPSSGNQIYLFDPGTGGSYTVNGMGAAVSASGEASFLFYDMRAQVFRTVPAGNYGPVTKLAVTWLNSTVVLSVNGVPRSSLAAARFGVKTLPAPFMNSLLLLATGEGTLARFDNVCQGIAATLTLDSGDRSGDVLRMLRGMSSWATRPGTLRAQGLPTISPSTSEAAVIPGATARKSGSTTAAFSEPTPKASRRTP